MTAKPRKRRAAPRKKKVTKGRAKKPPKLDADYYLRQLRAIKGVSDEDFAMFGEEIVNTPITQWIPTGNLAIDKLTGGGWPVGRIVEVTAWEGAGKSTLLDQSIAQCQAMGGIACLIDTEMSRTREYTSRLGVDVDRLLIHEAPSLERVFLGFEQVLQIQEQALRLTNDVPPLLLVWDSLGGTPAKAELEGAVDDAHVAVAAKVIKMNLRRLMHRIAHMRVAVVVANHFYKKIGFGGGNATYGGSGLKYFTSLRMELARVGQLKTSQGDLIGQEVQAKIRKTRIQVPGAPVKTALIFGAGFDNSYSLFHWGKEHGVAEDHRWVVQSGAWCWLYPPGSEPVSFQRTYLGLGQILSEHPDLYRAMATQFLETS